MPDPAVIHGTREDYRAGASYDRRLNDEGRKAGRKIACPTQVLWGNKGAVETWYDVLEV